MKTKIFYFFFLFCFSFSFGQKKITLSEVQKSEDPRLIAKFLKENPNHPQTDQLKTKLVTVLRATHNLDSKSDVKKTPTTSYKKQTSNNRFAVNASRNNSEKTLNHLLGGEKNSTEVYVQIANESKCNLIVKFSGKNYYNLDVPAGSQNYILIKKGNYQLTSTICDAKYSVAKKIYGDISIALSTR